MDHVTPPEALAHRRHEAGWERLPNYSRYVRVNLLETEGADHARVRRLVAAAFGPVASGSFATPYVRSSSGCSTSGCRTGEWTSLRISPHHCRCT